ncbi:MAG: hypothetical protein AB7S54_02035 [Bacteroidales bacterium]
MSNKKKIDLDGFTGTKELPFSVPEGYFDSLPGRVQEIIVQAHKQQATPVKWLFAFRSQLAFAAGFAFMAVIAYFGYYMAQPLVKNPATPSGVDYVNIVSRNITDFEDIDLYQAIEDRRVNDSIARAKDDIFRHYYVRSNNCITIIEEKEEIEP